MTCWPAPLLPADIQKLKYSIVITNPKDLILNKEKAVEIQTWLKEQTAGRYKQIGVFLGLELEQDALLFILTWG